jgi:hypothetical protein
MKLGVKGNLLTKFHKFLRILNILNKSKKVLAPFLASLNFNSDSISIQKRFQEA